MPHNIDWCCCWAAPLSSDSWSDGFQETAAWNLTTEEVLDLKELFMIFDSDKDGVLTFTQVKNAIGVLGKPIRGEYHQRVELWLEIDTLAFYSDEELLSIVKKFSADTKNLSVEFNEFLKMLAYHKNVKSVRSCEELVAAFGSVLSSCTITMYQNMNNDQGSQMFASTLILTIFGEDPHIIRILWISMSMSELESTNN